MTWKGNHMSGIQTPPAAASSSALRTKRTSRKSKKSSNGLSVKDSLANLSSSISLAKGLLATLSLGQKSDWTKKLAKTEPEHLRILLSDVMDEIWNADETLTRLMNDKRPRLTV